MQAVILAGGRGVRLRPLTYKIPKPMILINDRPFLDYQFDLLKRCGINKILLCVGYKWSSIERYFGDGKRFGLRISYSIEKRLLGTGGALKRASDLLGNEFLLLNGDTYIPLDYRNVIRRFRNSDKTGLLVVCRNKKNSPIGNISMSQNRLITAYRKISPDIKLRYLDAGVGVYKRRELLRLFPRSRYFSFEEEIYPKLINRNQLAGYICGSQFYDIGTFEGLKVFKGVR